MATEHRTGVLTSYNECLKSRPIVVTGIGRSGTGYMANVLSTAGIPCTHEGLLPDEIGRAVSNWSLAPRVDELMRWATIVHIVRHPYDVVSSQRAFGWWEQHSRIVKQVAVVLPSINDLATDLERAWYAFVEWNRMLFRHRFNPFYVMHRVEDEDALPDLLEALGASDPTNTFNNTNYNRQRPGYGRDEMRVGREDIPDSLVVDVLATAELMGYKDVI